MSAERDATEAPGQSGATLADHGAGEVAPTLPATPVAFARSGSTANGSEDGAAPLRYDVGDELGHGGMGIVRVAFDGRLGRRVALKELVALDARARERFEREAYITARLAHPSIIPIYDRGYLPGGRPFYVMKLVSGRSLRDLIAERPTLNERLGLVPMLLAAAEAVAYAHSEGVIHRDLKPHNILVGDFGETLVIDWGVAKELRAPTPPVAEPFAAEADRDPSRDEPLTEYGAVVGTPAYMPPEQAMGLEVDERADVYALGAILYQLLAGRSPYELTGGLGVIMAVRAGPPAAIRELVPGAPLDLAAIVTRAMAREAVDRYPNAAELAKDLRRFLTGQLVSAHVYRPSERVARWVRRHRLAVAIGAALIVTALVSVQRIVTERDRARTALADLQQKQDDLVLMHAQQVIERDPTAALAWLKRRRVLGDGLWQVRAVADAALALGAAQQIWPLDGFAVELQASRDGQTAVVVDRDGGVHRWRGDRARLPGRRGAIFALALADDGQAAVAGAADGARVYDLATGAIARTLPSPGGAVTAVGLDRSGAAYTASADGLLQRWDGSRPTVLARDIAEPRSLAVSPDGAWVAVGSVLGTITVAPTAGGAVRRLEAHTREVGRMAFTRDGKLISTGEEGTVREWDLASGTSRLLGRHDDWIATVALSPDEQWVATGGGDDMVRLWRRDGGQGRTLAGHEDIVYGVAFSPDGPDGLRVASAANDGTVRVWAVDGSDVLVLKTDRPARQVRFIDGGRGLIAAAGDRLYVWQRLPPLRHLLVGALGGINYMEWSPDGRHLAAGGRLGRTLVWDVTSGEAVLDTTAPEWVMQVHFADPDHLMIGTDRRAQRWDLAQRRMVQETASNPDARWPDFDDAGSTVAWMNGTTYGVTVVDLATGERADYGREIPNVEDYQLSPDGRRLVIGTRGGAVDLWWKGGGRRLATLGPVRAVGFTPDGARVVAQAGDGAAWVQDLATGATRSLRALAGARPGVALASDGRTAVAPVEGDLVVVDLGTGDSRRYKGHARTITHFAITADARIAASLDTGGTLRLWDLATGRQAQLRGHHHPDSVLDFSPDGRHLAAIDADGQVEVWPVAVDGSPSHGLRGWLDEVSSVVIGQADSRPVTPADGR